MSLKSWLGFWDERAIWREWHPTISVWRRIVKGHDNDEQKNARGATMGDPEDSRTASFSAASHALARLTITGDPLRASRTSAARRDR